MFNDRIVKKSKNSLMFSTEIIGFFYEEEIDDIVEIRRLNIRRTKSRQHFIINSYKDFKNAKRHDDIIYIAGIHPTINGEKIKLHDISSVKVQAEALKMEQEILNNIVKKSSQIITNFLFNFKEKTE